MKIHSVSQWQQIDKHWQGFWLLQACLFHECRMQDTAALAPRNPDQSLTRLKPYRLNVNMICVVWLWSSPNLFARVCAKLILMLCFANVRHNKRKKKKGWLSHHNTFGTFLLEKNNIQIENKQTKKTRHLNKKHQQWQLKTLKCH